jgi:hypothetical protein
MPSRDILFPLLIRGCNPADCGHSWQIVRTMRTGLRAHFGPFFVSRGSLSPKQPNHGHFGTDVESSIIQWVAWYPKGVGFAKAPLRRSEQGSKLSGSACPIKRRLGRFTVSSGRDGPPARRARVDPKADSGPSSMPSTEMTFSPQMSCASLLCTGSKDILRDRAKGGGICAVRP